MLFQGLCQWKVKLHLFYLPVINSSNDKSGVVITNSRENKTISIVHTLMIAIGAVLKGAEWKWRQNWSSCKFSDGEKNKLQFLKETLNVTAEKF